jgi:Protein of unknown function (DUF3035)
MKYAYLLLPLLCVACGGGELRETLGLNRRAPDEFRVVSRPPLTVPREFYLYPPDEAAAHGAADVTTNKARDALIGNPNDSDYLDHYQNAPQNSTTLADTAIPQVTSAALPSTGESSFLAKLGTNQGNPDIRKTLKEENKEEERKQDTSLLGSLKPDQPSEPEVDAKKERDRLNNNKQQGVPVNKGEVPIVTPKTSVLDRWF